MRKCGQEEDQGLSGSHRDLAAQHQSPHSWFNVLYRWFRTSCGSWISRLSLPQELHRRPSLQPHPRPPESQTLRVGLGYLGFILSVLSYLVVLGFWIQGLVLAKKVLCHLNHTCPSPPNLGLNSPSGDSDAHSSLRTAALNSAPSFWPHPAASTRWEETMWMGSATPCHKGRESRCDKVVLS
jgi:hypothetical protein